MLRQDVRHLGHLWLASSLIQELWFFNTLTLNLILFNRLRVHISFMACLDWASFMLEVLLSLVFTAVGSGVSVHNADVLARHGCQA